MLGLPNWGHSGTLLSHGIRARGLNLFFSSLHHPTLIVAVMSTGPSFPATPLRVICASSRSISSPPSPFTPSNPSPKFSVAPVFSSVSESLSSPDQGPLPPPLFGIVPFLGLAPPSVPWSLFSLLPDHSSPTSFGFPPFSIGSSMPGGLEFPSDLSLPSWLGLSLLIIRVCSP